jgi:hypothetical protein
VLDRDIIASLEGIATVSASRPPLGGVAGGPCMVWSSLASERVPWICSRLAGLAGLT